MALIATLEAQDVVNSDYRTAFRLATEWLAYDIFAFRMGFYTLSQNDMGVLTNKSRINVFTYSFGLVVPVNRMTSGMVPIDIHLDVTAQKQPELTTNSPNISPMRTVGLRVVWHPKTFSPGIEIGAPRLDLPDLNIPQP